MKIGLLGERFIEWDGGIDYIKNITNALISRPDVTVTLFIPYVKRNLVIKFVLDRTRRLRACIRTLIRERRFVIPKYVDPQQQSIIIAERAKEDFGSEFPNLSIITYRCRSVSDSHDALEKLMLSHGIDVALPATPWAPLPRNFSIPFISWVGDFNHKYFPEYFDSAYVVFYDKQIAYMLRNSKMLIANAQSVRRECDTFFPGHGANICALPFSPIPRKEYFNLDNISIDKYHLPQRYFLISNQFRRHKDHFTAIRALSLLLNDEIYKDVHIYCTGFMENTDTISKEYVREIKELIDELNLSRHFHLLGRLPKLEQIKILKHCCAVIQPTHYEGGPGGGITYEAVSLGKRVILSDAPVNLEAKSDLVTFFKVGDPIDLKTKMEQLLAQKAPTYTTEQLIERGKTQLEILSDSVMNMINKTLSEWEN